MFKALDKNPNDAAIVIEMTGDVRRTRCERANGRADGRTGEQYPLIFSRASIPPRPVYEWMLAECAMQNIGQSFSAANVQFLPINVTTFREKEIEFLFVHSVRKTRFFALSPPKRGQKADLLDHDCPSTDGRPIECNAPLF